MTNMTLISKQKKAKARWSTIPNFIQYRSGYVSSYNCQDQRKWADQGCCLTLSRRWLIYSAICVWHIAFFKRPWHWPSNEYEVITLHLWAIFSGLKVNFHKSEIFYFEPAKECGLQYSQLFGCKLGTYPFRYLSLPMHYRELNNKD